MKQTRRRSKRAAASTQSDTQKKFHIYFLAAEPGSQPALGDAMMTIKILKPSFPSKEEAQQHLTANPEIHQEARQNNWKVEVM